MTTTLITGATRGLGLETARRLAERGHNLFLGARDIDSGSRLAEELGAHAVHLDVTDPESVAAAAAAIGRQVSHLDVLVNNAGIAGEQRPPREASIDDLTRVLAVNVIGATRVLRGFTPLLEDSEEANVVNVSSAVGSLALNSSPDAMWSMLAYPMSKAALNMLTIQYARAFPTWRVNSVTPGLTNTDFISGDRGVSVEEGAEVIVRMADYEYGALSGCFVDVNGSVPW